MTVAISKEDAAKHISDLLADAQTCINDAMALADEHNLSFYMNLGEYGMGGYYEGDEASWNASSQNC